MNALLIAAAAVAIVATDPSPSASGGMIIFRKNEMVVTFNQPVLTHQIEVIDANGCKVSQDSAVDGAKVIVQMKACSRGGYPPGGMHISGTVNGASVEHHLHVRHHH